MSRLPGAVPSQSRSRNFADDIIYNGTHLVVEHSSVSLVEKYLLRAVFLVDGRELARATQQHVSPESAWLLLCGMHSAIWDVSNDRLDGSLLRA
jgi:hypothetical protein